MNRQEHLEKLAQKEIKFWKDYDEAVKRLTKIKDVEIKALNGDKITISLERFRTSEMNIAKIMGTKRANLYFRINNRKV